MYNQEEGPPGRRDGSGLQEPNLEVVQEEELLMEDEQQVRVIGICGSLRAGSHTRMALEICLEGAREVGADTELIDLRDYRLVFSDGKESPETYPDDVWRLKDKTAAADGIILGTPEYHGSFSGVLKNALDLMGFEEFEAKILGLVGVSGGGMGAVNALNGLRVVGRALHAWVLPEQVSVPEAWKLFDPQGRLKDEVLEGRLREVGRQVARFAYLHSSEEAREFIRAWENMPPNPGG
jgi:NAD(P)H-dependent FMN reductase